MIKFKNLYSRSNLLEAVWSAMLHPRGSIWASLTFAWAAGILALAQLPTLLSMVDINRSERVLATMPGLVWAVSWIVLSATAALQILTQAVLLVILIKLNRTPSEPAAISRLSGVSTLAWPAWSMWRLALSFMMCASLPFALQMMAHGLIELVGGSVDLNGLTWLVSDNVRPRDALAGLMWQVLWQCDLFFFAHVLLTSVALTQLFRIDRSNVAFASFMYGLGCALSRAITIAMMQAV